MPFERKVQVPLATDRKAIKSTVLELYIYVYSYKEEMQDTFGVLYIGGGSTTMVIPLT